MRKYVIIEPAKDRTNGTADKRKEKTMENTYIIRFYDLNEEDYENGAHLDIWASINSDIYKEEMKPLKQKYKKFLKAERRKMANVFVWAEYNARYDKRLY